MTSYWEDYTMSIIPLVPVHLLMWAAIGGYSLWILYLAVMNLYRAREAKTLSTAALVLGTPLLYGGLLLDFIMNQLVMTVILLEIPRELLVTTRLKRHILAESGYRKAVATWMCKNLLDAFDPSGCHCD